MTPAELWLGQNDRVITELREALTAASGSAGDFARALDGTTPDASVDETAALAAFHAENFAAAIRRAKALPPIPDQPVAQKALNRALDLWKRGAETLAKAARWRDAKRSTRAGQLFEQASKESWRWNEAMQAAIS